MKCWVKQSALDDIKSLCDDKTPLETGGLLWGYWVGDECVVCRVVGPGENAAHARLSFEPDYTHQNKEVDKLYALDNCEHYVGDWHSHPFPGIVAMSRQDTKTLQLIDNEVGNFTGLTLIIGGAAWRTMRVFCLAGELPTTLYA